VSRTFRIPLLATALSLALAAPAAACENEDLMPNRANLDEIRAATLCLLNEERGKRDLPKLRSNAKLRKAAERHSDNMVDKRFFDHTSPGGSTMVGRISSAGYNGWASLGENIGWGSGHLATPEALMRGWMKSAGHRENLLRPRFREVGIGISFGIPLKAFPGETGATYTTDFGVRR
jgi:uncharacterized protein YkwD